MEIQKIDINKLIPATYNPRKDLKPNDKLLMGLITSLSLKNGYCSANNDYLATEMNVSKRTITTSLSNLRKLGFISIQYEKYHRKIYNNVWKPTSRGIEDYFYTP